ncbi:MAG: hypothetical protein JSV17_14760 [Candidatus Aminicenantes bacterium]|nr:MAG: hypothetical protein JSV17_14760 [Candidatus Aminicenantes bacterium]
MKKKEKILRFNFYAGFLIFVISVILLFLRFSFMITWFYCFAWWSFILVMDSLNFRISKASPLSESAKSFLFSAFISVFVWLIFELFNLRLKNWHYHDLPSFWLERWLGYFIAFASVIPAIWEISYFIEGFLKKKNLALFQLKISPSFLKLCIFLGALFFFLTIGWPRLFFPLVWLCFIFLLEPLNYRLKNVTFLADLERKNWTRLLSWILGGLVAGFFWELWNSFAGSHWEYSLPYLNFWRIFHMPVFGYTGFMPFALEIFAFYQLFTWGKKELEKRILVKAFIFIFFILFYLGCFYLIDSYSLVHPITN